MDRVILHCDLNNFYASVEVIKNPSLRGKAIAVCGDPEMRHGIVLAKSEVAKKAGVKTGMPIWQAKQLCPDIIIVTPHHNDYSRYSKIVQGVYYRYTDLVEPFGGDECWLDITGIQQLKHMTPKQIADEIRKVIRDEIGLSISVGVSWNKTFAKLGSDMKKPDATTVISRENYHDVIYNLPVADMLFVGRKTALVLNRMNILTIGDLASADADILKTQFGKNATQMVKTARGDDDEAVKAFHHKREIKSVGNGTTPPRDLVLLGEIDQVLYALCEEVSSRMRRKGVKGTTIHLSIRDEKLKWSGQQTTIQEPTNSCTTIHRVALGIFTAFWGSVDFPSVRSLRVAVSSLTRDYTSQMSFLDVHNEKQNDKISNTFDVIRKKYGSGSIMYGTGINGEFKIDIEVQDEPMAF